jgi:hypothetical protein
MIPDGADQDPSSVLATKTPEPPAPEIQSPVRIVVKMARPTAFSMTLWGIFFRTFCAFFGPASSDDGAGSSV